jgi:hypothetical protein
MSDVAAANTAEARTETGEIKDQTLVTSKETVTESKAPTDTTQVETKPAEAKPADKPAAGVPEKYEFSAPEGFEIDEKFAGEASAVFKELGLTQDQASKLVKMYTDKVGADADAPYRKYEEIRTGWRNEVTADPALGNGTDLKPEIKAVLGRAIDGLGAKEAASFREAMEITGAGDHPAVVRAMVKWAQKAGEGTAVRGGGPSEHGQGNSSRPTSAAKAIYPNLP